MPFKNPEYLWLLLAIPAAIWLFAYAARKRLEALHVFYEGREAPEKNYAKRIARSRRWRAAFLLGGCALLIAALAGPFWGLQIREAEQESLDLIVALDVSASMSVEDVSPSRLDRAKLAIAQLIEQRPGDRVGLVVFAGDAFLQCPLTSDRSAFRLFLDASGANSIATPGTNFANALAVARRAFAQEGSPGDSRGRVILVVSDGENHESGLEEVLDVLENAGISVLAAGIGTEAGGPIPTTQNGRATGFKRDENGAQIISRYEEGVLRDIAGPGNVVRLGESEAASALSIRLNQFERSIVATMQLESEANRFQWPLGFALLFLLIERLIWLRGTKFTVTTSGQI
ncbi:MAG: VWA domain-containing protein [Rubricoccaceae bacterium]|nr:VWA domain-containing protein [Rubricoccaceae bacterium]